MNNINENIEPVKEIVQNQNIVENQQIEELKIENEGIFNFIINEYLSEQCKKMKKKYIMQNFLEQLLFTHTPSGYENLGKIRELVNQIICDKHDCDTLHNLYFIRKLSIFYI